MVVRIEFVRTRKNIPLHKDKVEEIDEERIKVRVHNSLL
jgi:hypothetical protein